MNWIILKTDFRKEQHVARQVEAMGFPAWVPCQIITCRTGIGRRVTAKAAIQLKELPILPKRLFAAIPEAVHGDLASIRHLVAIERDAASEPLRIPFCHIQRFREEIDRENTAALALAQKASRKQKAKWRSLHDALLDLIEQAKTAYEVAA